MITYDEAGVGYDSTAYTYDGTAISAGSPAQGGFVALPIPEGLITREFKSKYRVHRTTHLRLFIRVTHAHKVTARKFEKRLSIAAEQSAPRLAYTQARTTEIAKAARVEKRATPESVAWVRERNIEDLTELALLLASRR